MHDPHCPRPKEAEQHVRIPRIIATALIALTIAIAALPAQAETPSITQLRAENRTLRAEVKEQTARGDKWRLKYLSEKTWWTQGDIRFAATEAADKAGLTGALRTWAIEACVYTAKREAGKKWGDKKHTYKLYSTHSVNGQHMGLHQWNRGWKGTVAQKTNGVWSCNRFMRVVKDGGKAKVIQHWAATIGIWRYR